LLSLLAGVSCSTDPRTSIARSLFSEDLFLTHMSSDFVNKSIDPCDNFYRRICPKDFPVSSIMLFKLMKQLEIVMNM
ncbi:hypothetical protein PFISCL1PPCAC_25842, partial [Pristionchus fissidentatus]